MRVLLADDDLISRAMLARVLTTWDHEVTSVADGIEAWEAFRNQPFPLVISDWMMPNMDGLELVRRIRDRPDEGYVYILLLTARSEKEDVVEGMEAGADDFVTKPFDEGELRSRLRAGERILRLEQNLAQRNRDLEAANGRMKRDLEAAARIQKSLLPVSLPETNGLRISWAFEPCDELAGDILNVFPLDEQHIGLYVLDVSGHGVPSALLSVTLSRLLTPAFEQSSLLKRRVKQPPHYDITPPERVAAYLNRQFPLDERTGQYFTLLYGILDTRSLELRYAQAGQPPPIHIAADGAARMLEGGGLPIGFSEEGVWEPGVVRLCPGDRLYLYSDGAYEALSPSEERFGFDRLLGTFRDSRSLDIEQSVRETVVRLREWIGPGRPPYDDVTLLALEATGD